MNEFYLGWNAEIVMTNNGGFLTPETQTAWRRRILAMSPRLTCQQDDEDDDTLHEHNMVTV
jgi:hypothetical protein